MDSGRIAGAFGYDREKGHFILWPAKAVVIATGGIGRAYKITSNSWEYTGDGHALAYRAGAELMDMEFVQFHPTGMVWPISVRGILVTEGVRGEGGVLRNSEGRRFMFDDIPDLYKAQTADNEEEGWRYTQGDKNARRPPELLTRDHVARCINREVKAGRGSPHGGVYLDIAWIKEHIPKAAEHIKRKLPSMYHQFKQLADIDITKEPMEVGPTTHYMMGGIRVDGDSQMSTVPGLFAAGEAAAGLHGANRLGGNSLSDLLVFGKRAGQYRRRVRQTQRRRRRGRGAGARPPRKPRSSPSSADPRARIRIRSSTNCRNTCRIWSASCARESEMQQALECDRATARREPRARASRATASTTTAGTPPWIWRTCWMSPRPSRAPRCCARKAAARSSARISRTKTPEWGKYNIVVRRGADGEMLVEKRPIAADARRAASRLSRR